MTGADAKPRLNIYLARSCAVTAILSLTLGVTALVIWQWQGLSAIFLKRYTKS